MDVLTRFEKARLVSARALQLSLGAPPLIDPPKNSSMFELASLEFEKKAIPLVVQRRLPNGEIQRVRIE
jgi:DNA-directed RNA polymerase subunit K/omega